MKTTIPPRRPGGALLVSALALIGLIAGCNTCYHCPQECPYGYDTSAPLYDRIVFGWMPDWMTLRSDHQYPEAAPVLYRVPPRASQTTSAREGYDPVLETPLEAETMPAPMPQTPTY